MAGEHLKPEYKALNPNCLVPMLDDNGFRLTESGAILRYLAGLSDSTAYPSDLNVITSYSIHYTKLYDDENAVDGDQSPQDLGAEGGTEQQG